MIETILMPNPTPLPSQQTLEQPHCVTNPRHNAYIYCNITPHFTAAQQQRLCHFSPRRSLRRGSNILRDLKVVARSVCRYNYNNNNSAYQVYSSDVMIVFVAPVLICTYGVIW